MLFEVVWLVGLFGVNDEVGRPALTAVQGLIEQAHRADGLKVESILKRLGRSSCAFRSSLWVYRKRSIGRGTGIMPGRQRGRR